MSPHSMLKNSVNNKKGHGLFTQSTFLLLSKTEFTLLVLHSGLWRLLVQWRIKIFWNVEVTGHFDQFVGFKI